MGNVELNIRTVEADLKSLFQKIIREKKLIDTGRLYSSIEFKMNKTIDGYTFQMKAEDYFKYLDEKFGITKAAMETYDFKRIQEKISDIYFEDALNEIIKDTNNIN